MDTNYLPLNLLGKRFYLPQRILLDHPETLLGNEDLLGKYYRPIEKDYYFERNPLFFPYIITYYTLDKKIFCPHAIPVKLLEIECDFFRLHDRQILIEEKRHHHPRGEDEITYQYFSQCSIQNTQHQWLDWISLTIGILFMIDISLETYHHQQNAFQQSWSLSYMIELLSTLLLTSSILYRFFLLRIDKNNFNGKTSFLFDFLSSLFSMISLIIETFLHMGHYRLRIIFILICKTGRLLMIIGHLHQLTIILTTFIHQFRTICILVMINILIVACLSEIAFAFERRQLSNQQRLETSTMKTHLDAFWWATSLSFTIGFGYTDPHSTLTTVGRFCSYILVVFGLLFNGILLQELIKEFLKLSHQTSRKKRT